MKRFNQAWLSYRYTARRALDVTGDTWEVIDRCTGRRISKDGYRFFSERVAQVIADERNQRQITGLTEMRKDPC